MSLCMVCGNHLADHEHPCEPPAGGETAAWCPTCQMTHTGVCIFEGSA